MSHIIPKNIPICLKIQLEFGVQSPHQCKCPLVQHAIHPLCSTTVPQQLAHEGCGEH